MKIIYLTVICLGFLPFIVKSQTIFVLTDKVPIRLTAEPVGKVRGYLNVGDTVGVWQFKDGYYLVAQTKAGKTLPGGFISDLYVPKTDEFVKLRKSYYDLHHLKDPAAPRQKATAIKLGMSTLDLVDVLGSPTKVNTTTGVYGTHEQWIYRYDYGKTRYFYFDNDRLTTIQDN